MSYPSDTAPVSCLPDSTLLPCVLYCVTCRARLVATSRAGSPDEPSTSSSSSIGSAADRSHFNQLEWAHELSRPEAGCLLLAHPYMFRERQRYFYQAVILLLDHGPEGSYGIILNRPTQYKVRRCNMLFNMLYYRCSCDPFVWRASPYGGKSYCRVWPSVLINAAVDAAVKAAAANLTRGDRCCSDVQAGLLGACCPWGPCGVRLRKQPVTVC